jgi:hypothetical protein
VVTVVNAGELFSLDIYALFLSLPISKWRGSRAGETTR